MSKRCERCGRESLVSPCARCVVDEADQKGRDYLAQRAKEEAERAKQEADRNRKRFTQFRTMLELEALAPGFVKGLFWYFYFSRYVAPAIVLG